MRDVLETAVIQIDTVGIDAAMRALAALTGGTGALETTKDIPYQSARPQPMPSPAATVMPLPAQRRPPPAVPPAPVQGEAAAPSVPPPRNFSPVQPHVTPPPRPQPSLPTQMFSPSDPAPCPGQATCQAEAPRQSDASRSVAQAPADVAATHIETARPDTESIAPAIRAALAPQPQRTEQPHLPPTALTTVPTPQPAPRPSPPSTTAAAPLRAQLPLSSAPVPTPQDAGDAESSDRPYPPPVSMPAAPVAPPSTNPCWPAILRQLEISASLLARIAAAVERTPPQPPQPTY